MTDANSVLVSVSHGHAFKDHQGDFYRAGFNVRTQSDVYQLAREVANNPNTRAFMNVDSHELLIFDRDKKIMMALNDSRSTGDAGSMYPVNNFTEKIQERQEMLAYDLPVNVPQHGADFTKPYAHLFAPSMPPHMAADQNGQMKQNSVVFANAI